MNRRQVLVGLAGVVGTAACGGGGATTNPIGPSNQPEIGNSPDNFQFQASSLSRTTQTLTYTWTNTGTFADVNQSGRIDAGDATLTLRDGAGNQVYTRSLRNTGTFASARGAAGPWRIDVQISEVTGTLNFRVQKGS
jgi:hypothetical protein